MKKIILALILVYVVLVFLYTGGSSKSFAEVEKGVKKELQTEELKDVSAQGLKRYYGLNSADYDGVMMYISTSSMSAEEILLIKVKEDTQIQEIEECISNRIESRKNDFDGYAPKQVKMLENAQKSIRGKYVFLAVSKKSEEYRAAFSRSL